MSGKGPGDGENEIDIDGIYRSSSRRLIFEYRPDGKRFYFLRHVAKWIFAVLHVGAALRFMCRRVWKTDRRKVLFSNFWGRGFGDNPKYVALELLRRRPDLDIVWVARDVAKTRRQVPPGVRVAQYGGVRGLREFATAAVRVDNQVSGAFLTINYVKKPDQTYIQTWHGSLGLKKIGFDFADGSPERDYRYMVRRLDGSRVDYLVSNSAFESEIYRRQWFGGGRVVEFGHPRNDILVNGADAAALAAFRRAAGYPDGERVFLYAPTFRDDESTDGYGLDYPALLAALSDRFGGKWRIAIRRHPKTPKSALPVPEGGIDASDYPDMQELLSVTDAMATDYSSCVCDFLFTGRPAFLYAPDRAKYENDRGFYYPLEETPFPIAETPAALADCVRSFDADAYAAKTASFLKARGAVEDGRASERVVDLIEKELAK